MVLETIKQHLRNSTVQAIFLRINAKTLEYPGPCSVLGGRALTQDWGERGGGGGVPISDFIRLAGIQVPL